MDKSYRFSGTVYPAQKYSRYSIVKAKEVFRRNTVILFRFHNQKCKIYFYVHRYFQEIWIYLYLSHMVSKIGLRVNHGYHRKQHQTQNSHKVNNTQRPLWTTQLKWKLQFNHMGSPLLLSAYSIKTTRVQFAAYLLRSHHNFMKTRPMNQFYFPIYFIFNFYIRPFDDDFTTFYQIWRCFYHIREVFYINFSPSSKCACRFSRLPRSFMVFQFVFICLCSAHHSILLRFCLQFAVFSLLITLLKFVSSECQFQFHFQFFNLLFLHSFQITFQLIGGVCFIAVFAHLSGITFCLSGFTVVPPTILRSNAQTGFFYSFLASYFFISEEYSHNEEWHQHQFDSFIPETPRHMTP